MGHRTQQPTRRVRVIKAKLPTPEKGTEWGWPAAFVESMTRAFPPGRTMDTVEATSVSEGGTLKEVRIVVRRVYCLLLGLLVLLPACTTWGATRYCDLSLAADGAGTFGDPWQWSQAINASNLSAGDTVYLRGTKTGSISLTASNAKGTPGSALTYAAWEGEAAPVVNGSVTVTGPGDFYLVFDGLSTYSAGLVFHNVHHLTWKNSDIVGTWAEPMDGGMTWYAVEMSGTDGDILLEDCDLSNGYFGIVFDGATDSPCTLRRCVVHHVSGPNFQWDTANGSALLTIEDCVAYDQQACHFTAGGETTHGTGISLWNDNVTVRRCVVRDCGNTALFRTYPDHLPDRPAGGYSNITVEDSLFYDVVCNGGVAVQFNALADNIKISGNTFVSRYRYYPNNPCKAQQYEQVLQVGIANYAGYPSHDGSDVHFYNNLLVGTLGCSNRNIDEDYNFMLSWFGVGDDGGFYFYQTPLGAHSTIVAYAMADGRTPPDNRGQPGSYNSPFTGDPFAGSGNFFLGSALFDTYHAQHTQSSGLGNHGQDLTTAYKPTAGNAWVVNAGVPGYGSGKAVDGASRDATPDIGAYEHTASPGTYYLLIRKGQ